MKFTIFYLILLVNCTTQLTIEGEFYYCPSHVPNDCFTIKQIFLDEIQTAEYCTTELMCRFFIKNRLVQGFLFDNYVIKESSKFIDCSLNFHLLLHNNANKIYIQRINKTFHFYKFKIDNKVTLEEVFILTSFSILSLISIFLTVFLVYNTFFRKVIFNISGDKI